MCSWYASKNTWGKDKSDFCPEKREKKAPNAAFRNRCFWQREKDSNPHKQSQSLLCYLYTIPLYRLNKM